MVSGQHRAGEVVKAPGAGLAPIALPAPLHIIVPVADHRTAVTAGAAHALWPAVLAHKGEALGVVHQAGKVDQVRCSHDGRSSSREPVGCSRSSHHSRCSPNALPKPTTPEHDKSLEGMQPTGNTNITLGVTWGLATLSESKPLTGGAAF